MRKYILNVTIVDDSIVSRKMIIRALPEKLKENLYEAVNGVEALDKFREGKADIMFLDLTMPIMNGIEVLSELKKSNAKIHIFVLSADIQPTSRQQVNDLGATAFLKKPLDEDLLLNLLKDEGLI